MIKIVVLGSNGMLGQELFSAFNKDQNYEVHGFDVDSLDVTNFASLGETLADIKPDIVLNAIAYNGVDLAETSDEEWGSALTLNVQFPEELARLSRILFFILVHYSSDYVFDGSLQAPTEKKCQGACCGGNCHGTKEGYDEQSLPNPLSRYGETKYAGERAVQKNTDTYYVIRLSKLFGVPAKSQIGKKSFFESMLDLGTKNSEIKVIQGELSCFTYAPDLAQATKTLVESKNEYGTYHLVNEGAVTWYEGVIELFRQAGLTTHVQPVSPSTFPRAAKRPAMSVLLNTKFPKMRHYSEAIADFLKVKNNL